MRILSFGEWDTKVNALRFSYFASLALMQETSSTSLSRILETPGTQKSVLGKHLKLQQDSPENQYSTCYDSLELPSSHLFSKTCSSSEPQHPMFLCRFYVVLVHSLSKSTCALDMGIYTYSERDAVGPPFLRRCDF